jgi:hypothetical protein
VLLGVTVVVEVVAGCTRSTTFCTHVSTAAATAAASPVRAQFPLSSALTNAPSNLLSALARQFSSTASFLPAALAQQLIFPLARFPDAFSLAWRQAAGFPRARCLRSNA